MTHEGLDDEKLSWVTPTCEKLVDEILKERESRYGDFFEHAYLAQQLKKTLHSSPNWVHLNDMQKESLEMQMHKVARILNGDPNYRDSWIDIAGYAQLIADRLEA